MDVKKSIVIVLLVVAGALVGCDDAQIASRNISKASDMFEVDRRVVFYNGITDKYILTIEGKCSINADRLDRQLEVTCKVGSGNDANAFKKHYLGLSDNVTYFVEQLKPRGVSVYHYRVVFKPQTVLPDIRVKANRRALKGLLD